MSFGCLCLIHNHIWKIGVNSLVGGYDGAVYIAVMSIAFCSMVIGEPEVPRFIADRPFLAAIVAHDTLYFMAMHRGK
ncbi:unnamed protein product, partial [Brenthis ino]